MTTAGFAAQWILDELPACPVGIALLNQFAEDAPGLYAEAEHIHFADTDNPAVAANSFWRAFNEHYANCRDCNED